MASCGGVLLDQEHAYHSGIGVAFDVAMEKPEAGMGECNEERIGRTRHQRHNLARPGASAKHPQGNRAAGVDVQAVLHVTDVHHVKLDGLVHPSFEGWHRYVELLGDTI